MTAAAAWAAEEDAFQARAVTHGGSARRGPVGTHIIFMKNDIGFPGDGVKGIHAAHVALGARWPASRHAGKIAPMAIHVGAARIPVEGGVSPVEGVGKIPPQERVHRSLIPEVAFRARHARRPAEEIVPVAVGAGVRVEVGLRFVPAGKPPGSMGPAHRLLRARARPEVR